MTTSLHQARLDAVIQQTLSSDARRVVDLGCGSGDLLLWLRDHHRFTCLLGIDTDIQALAQARARLGLDLLHPDQRLQLRIGSFDDTAWVTNTVDAAIMLETIEHMDPARLSRVEQVVFDRLAPRLVLITTPNRDYNVLHGLAPDQRRHPGHRFEWSRRQFQSWCRGVAQRRGFRVSFSDIGPGDPVHGSSTQMARFDRYAEPVNSD